MADLRILIDFENSKKLQFLYKASTDDEYKHCFDIEHVNRYLPTQGLFMQMQVSTGSRFTMKVELYQLRVLEKKHKLDVDDSLLVSHELVEEIFDKVAHFTDKIGKNTETLRSIQELQSSLLTKSRYLEIFTKDLYLGTRRFQEHMMENLNKYKLVNPESLPKMSKIRQSIKTLEAKQSKIFERFMTIKSLLSAKKVFKRTRAYLRRMDNVVEDLSAQVTSPEFTGFFKKTSQLIELLKNMNFRKLVEEVA